jgi:NADH dehydrogenase
MEICPKHIVLLGGGYVSIWAYRSLVSRLGSQVDRGAVKITVVCPHEYHMFHGWTAETLMGIVQNHHRQSSLAEVMPKARLLIGWADEIDTDLQRVHVRLPDNTRQTLPYDHLMLGIGSVDSQAVMGIQAHGYQIKSPESFEKTRQAIHRLIRQAATADRTTAQELLRFAIAGGGFAGVELATNLAEFINVVKNEYPALWSVESQIWLINATERILPSLQPDFKQMIRYAEKIMQDYGIGVINNTRITKVTEQGAYLSDGTFLECSMVISTIGQCQISLKGTEHMARDANQRLITNAYQQLCNQTNIWGGGDSCHVPHVKTGEACPANALWAIKHGEYGGRNIARALLGKPLKPFTYRGLGQAASLGLGKGISELYGFQITGLLSWIMRWFFFHYFMPSRRCMLNTIGDWLHLFVRRQRKGWRIDELETQPERFMMKATT